MGNTHKPDGLEQLAEKLHVLFSFERHTMYQEAASLIATHTASLQQHIVSLEAALHPFANADDRDKSFAERQKAWNDISIADVRRAADVLK